MKTIRWCCALALGLLSIAAQARDVTVATWNLGWHMSDAEAHRWIAECNAPFAQGANGRWRRSDSGTAPGWALTWGRDAPIDGWDIGTIAPCDVYQAGRRIVPVTERAWRLRNAQIAMVLGERVDADVIAFQEVSGEQSIRDVLPGPASEWQVCSFTGYKVQRTAFAWRTSLGARNAHCSVAPALALPARTKKEQPRPGLALDLVLDGRHVRFLTVHLKSSCVSPLESRDPNGRGQLAGTDEACGILRDQLEPLRQWYEESTRGVDAVVLLGDFNRNLFHEAVMPTSADGRPASLMRVLQRDIAPAYAPHVVPEACPQGGLDAICAVAKDRVLDRNEYQRLIGTDALGCRNPIGLDHIVIGGAVSTTGAEKVALGVEGWTTAAGAGDADPSLAVSDHCPLKARLTFAGVH